MLFPFLCVLGDLILQRNRSAVFIHQLAQPAPRVNQAFVRQRHGLALIHLIRRDEVKSTRDPWSRTNILIDAWLRKS